MSPASWRAGQRFSSRLAAWISCLRTRSWSSVSRMVKLDWRPTSSAWLRSIRAATEWKVPSHGMPSIAPPESAPTRSRISRAALLVKVTARIWLGQALAGGDQMGEAGGQRGGLAGAGAGEDEHRPFGRQHRLALRRVQALQIGGLGTERRRFRHLAEVSGGERNGNRQAGCNRQFVRRFRRLFPISPLSTGLSPKFLLPRLGERCAWCIR